MATKAKKRPEKFRHAHLRSLVSRTREGNEERRNEMGLAVNYNLKLVMIVGLPLLAIVVHASFVFMGTPSAGDYRIQALWIAGLGGAIALYGTMLGVIEAFHPDPRPKPKKVGVALRHIGGSFALYGLWLSALAEVS